MRLLSQLLVAFIICLVAVALPAVPAQAAVCLPYGIDLAPKNGPPGTEVTVSGHGFAEDTLVDIYYYGTSQGTKVAAGRTDSSGDFTLKFTVPEGTTGPYEVEADVWYTRVSTYFTVRPGLTVSPEAGPEGTNVTVQGRGFAKNEADIMLMYYYLSGAYKTVESNIVANADGSWQVNFPIPTSLRGEHKMDADGAVSKPYEVKDAVFRVTADISIAKSSGFAGDSITMTGRKFAAYERGIDVLFDGQAVATDIRADAGGDWEATFQVPDMPAGEYAVTAEGEQTKREDLVELRFRIGQHIVLSAYEGYVGIDLMVTGHGFAAGEDVDITYDDSQIATAQTDAEGDFEASFTVPESQHGEHKIAAGYGGENHANASFTMESNAPATPTLISPSQGSRLGFTGGATPTLRWSETPDDSGVCYSVRIATSDDFAASSIIDSATGLTETSYTPDKALPHGTYYWTVQAMDGAENESGWAAVRSFRVGLLPMWGLILAIVGAVVLLAFLIRALVVRRSIYYDRW